DRRYSLCLGRSEDPILMSTTTINLSSAEPQATKDLGQETRTPRQMYIKRFRQNPLCIIGGVLILFLLFLALFGPFLAPHDPLLVTTADRFVAPGSEYFFGTDEFGRDIFSRILYGARIAVQVGLVSVVVAFVGGIILGLV